MTKEAHTVHVILDCSICTGGVNADGFGNQEPTSGRSHILCLDCGAAWWAHDDPPLDHCLQDCRHAGCGSENVHYVEDIP